MSTRLEKVLPPKVYATLLKCTEFKLLSDDCEDTAHTHNTFYVIDKEGNHSDSATYYCTSVIEEIEDTDADYIVQKLKDKRNPYSSRHPITYNKYLKWLCNESPWSDCIITKTPQEIRKYGFIFSGDFPYNYAMGASVALRLSFENRSFVARWNSLIKNGGADPLAAFILAHYIVSIGDNDTKIMCLSEGYLGNSPISYVQQLSQDEIGNIYSKTFVNPEGNLNTNPCYGHTTNLWGDVDEYDDKAHSALWILLSSLGKPRQIKVSFGTETIQNTVTRKDLKIIVERYNTWLKS